MKLAIFAFTRKGCCLAQRCREALRPEECRMVTMEKFCFSGFEAYRPPLSACMGGYFSWADQILFIGSTGMAVRAIAPWVKDKKTDPGVLVADEGGTFVISLLSGHIGGANALTVSLAKAIGAQSVVTTATDVEKKFSVDSWAVGQNLHIGSMELCKAVSATILEGDIPLCSQYPISGTLPKGLVAGNTGPLGIYVGLDGAKPFENTLVLTPRLLTLGLGCRKGTPEVAIKEAVDSVFSAHGLRLEGVAGAASIDLKAEEPGLRSYCEKANIPIRFYSAEELRQVAGEFTQSTFVRSVTGVDNVCERAAVKAGGKLIVAKTACQGVTVAVSRKDWEVSF